MLPRFTILGARGSRPVCDPAYHAYGGNTTCFLIETADGPILIDAGTGLSAFDADWAAGDPRPITLLMTHFHLDHLAGLPAARFLYQPDRQIRCFADPDRDPDARRTLADLLRPPYWPIRLDQAGAVFRYADLNPGGAAVDINGLTVEAMALHHPQGSLGLRFSWPGCRLVVATDHEPGVATVDADLVAFAQQADYLLLDAQFMPSQRRHRTGWGHGDWERAVALAQRADVRHLILIHHDPAHDDVCLRDIEQAAQRVFAPTWLAREGMRLPFDAPSDQGDSP